MANYEIKLIKKIIERTYEITKIIFKSGIVYRVIIGFVTVVVALGLIFGSFKRGEPVIKPQIQIERRLQDLSSTHQAMEDL